ncbi:MAG: nicotinate-nucleotide adenylyltransferase [Azospirillaceae bacterium]|nr:nicotinate-nucleotide adenylyltransferase [Azospirillaceae bacterium]
MFPVPRPLRGRPWVGLTVGLLGGSFNPAHDGHRHISLYALRALHLDAVWWLVSPQNPLKPSRGMAALDWRLAAAHKVARHPRLVITAIEQELGTRYTADTLAALHRRFPRTRFVWLMGADNLAQIARWQRWQRLFDSTAIAVFARPTYSLKALGSRAAQRYRRRRIVAARAATLAAQSPPAWSFLRNRLHPASATEIRRRTGAGSLPTDDRQAQHADPGPNPPQ